MNAIGAQTPGTVVKGRYGVIAAMKIEAERLVTAMEDVRTETVGGIEFVTGRVRRSNPQAGGQQAEAELVVAVCGIGKVFAAMCAQTMIVRFAPGRIINTGIAGTLSPDVGIGDVVIATDVVEHDVDTTALGDPPGFISGLDTVRMHCGERLARSELRCAAYEVVGTERVRFGVIATGDQFIADPERKRLINGRFGAVACEMEGGAVGQVCTANEVPFAVVRTISDGADGKAPADYPAFAAEAARTSAEIVLRAATMIW
jgi:adenosylhomocysteine nucleosidase